MAAERTNRLAAETSPYLLQHAHNPVDWYPWGDEALAAARSEDRPILLSVGYAACHWCHVMERESFEDETTARLMNELFVNIKVDREERPDLDDIYMRSVQMMTGRGGWPLTAFLTPELQPFYGGTYFPPQDRPGMPSFRSVLAGVAEAYEQRRDEVVEVARQLQQRLQPQPPGPGATELVGSDLVHRAAMELHDRFDPNYGGFGPAPKFPQTTSISLLLRYAWQHADTDLLEEAVFTLEQMAAGGIYDHVGGGFHRYSTDARWLVPHFEKMLYDNALLVVAYLDAYQLTGHEQFAEVVRETLDWVIREMQSPRGGYYSTLDADSEGVEGKFYVWGQDEIAALLGDAAAIFGAAYDVTADGNWEGANILNRSRPHGTVADEHGIAPADLQGRLAAGRQTLRAARQDRVRPGLDDKVLADWNGLMIAAMARAARILEEPRYAESAVAAAEFIEQQLRPNGRLLHTWRADRARLLAYLDDHANMMWACLELFETTYEARWLRAARHYADELERLFWDPEGDGFFLTGSDHEELIAKSKSAHDGATPAGNAVAATWLQRLAVFTGEPRYDRLARDLMYAFAPQFRRLPSGFAQMMLAIADHVAPRREIVVVGSGSDERTQAALRRLRRRYAPTDLLVHLDPDRSDLAADVPLLEGKVEPTDTNGPLFYVCRNSTCDAPTTNIEDVVGSD